MARAFSGPTRTAPRSSKPPRPPLLRLRVFGARVGGALICLCSRIALSDGRAAVLVISTERAGKDLSLPDRAARLLAGLDRTAAIFSADGELIEASTAARKYLADRRDLEALGAEKLAREASLNGRADGELAGAPVTMLRLGAGATVTLLLAAGASAKTVSVPVPQAIAPEVVAPMPVVAPAPTPAPPPTATETPARRYPFRFVWQMDAPVSYTHLRAHETGRNL